MKKNKRYKQLKGKLVKIIYRRAKSKIMREKKDICTNYTPNIIRIGEWGVGESIPLYRVEQIKIVGGVK